MQLQTPSTPSLLGAEKGHMEPSSGAIPFLLSGEKLPLLASQVALIGSWPRFGKNKLVFLGSTAKTREGVELGSC